MDKVKISDTGEESGGGTEVADDKVEASDESSNVETPVDAGAAPENPVDGGTAAEVEVDDDTGETAEAEPSVDDPDDVEPSVDDPDDVEPSVDDPDDVEPTADDAGDGEAGADVVAVDADRADSGGPVDADEAWEPDEAEFEVADYEASDAAYAHAPTSAEAHLVAEHPDDAGAGRRSEFLWWLLTPLSVLVIAPVLAASTSFLVALNDTGYPAICRDAAPDNRCEEVVLRMAGQHTIAFAIGWLALWALPWRRSVRPYRIGLAILIVLILLAAPLRLLASVDYHA
ncbi:hypothetical protein HH310_14530 [Actinoplanes sp. TBRC 11911]|uniref:hypothetical protein n=1 Tax=Actinoplanes sp. TBRC 11911 TaxID=2729386 RepID=UPI00145E321F|nr:hypothetical protein [Actinoplanes sp. TBRC 11911]NMO52404.1 hypothetical protein [Actinoplanes sp. TBRC 11911]